MNELVTALSEIPATLDQYILTLENLNEHVFIDKKNSQNRSVKEIIGHMIDSASNNTHRIVHLQYRKSPLEFPNYAIEGGNDKWISIQNYQEEDLAILLPLWKFSHLHFLHVVQNVQKGKLKQEWISGTGENITLKEMILDFPRHFFLHIREIDELIEN
jgi:hypothetical protein